MMVRMKHVVLLAREVASYSAENGAWWVLVLFPLIFLAMAIVGAAHATVPYAVYTLF
mgnify:CR=1 FL=1